MARLSSFWITSALLTLLFLLEARASPVGTVNNTKAPRSRSDEKLSPRFPSTCADASLAKPVYLAFAGIPVAHVVNFRWVLANADTTASSAYWTLQGDIFQAWQTQQPFTVPLFALVNADGTDYVSLTGVDAATPPVISGFRSIGVVAWVYADPQCGSVPLYSLANGAFSDHYYTVEISDRDNMVLNGWTDGGIVAYVLPL